jgi:hypothetical protein
MATKIYSKNQTTKFSDKYFKSFFGGEDENGGRDGFERVWGVCNTPLRNAPAYHKIK